MAVLGGQAEGTLGVILEIPEPLRESLSAVRQRFAPMDAPQIPPHITLVSGAHAYDWKDAVDHVRTVVESARTFSVSIDGVGTFRPLTPVVYLQIIQGARELEALRRAMRTAALEYTAVFSYHPHITIAHDVEDATLDEAAATMADFSAQFEAKTVGIYESGLDGTWLLKEELSIGAHSTG